MARSVESHRRRLNYHAELNDSIILFSSVDVLTCCGDVGASASGELRPQRSFRSHHPQPPLQPSFNQKGVEGLLLSGLFHLCSRLPQEVTRDVVKPSRGRFLPPKSSVGCNKRLTSCQSPARRSAMPV